MHLLVTLEDVIGVLCCGAIVFLLLGALFFDLVSMWLFRSRRFFTKLCNKFMGVIRSLIC